MRFLKPTLTIGVMILCQGLWADVTASKVTLPSVNEETPLVFDGDETPSNPREITELQLLNPKANYLVISEGQEASKATGMTTMAYGRYYRRGYGHRYYHGHRWYGYYRHGYYWRRGYYCPALVSIVDPFCWPPLQVTPNAQPVSGAVVALSCASQSSDDVSSCTAPGKVVSMRLADPQSKACVAGSTFGADGDSLWVANGCAANFIVHVD